MGRYNEALIEAGVMLAGEGLHPTSRSRRVVFSPARRTVVDGPFADARVVAGFWLWQVKSIEEAVEWVTVPRPHGRIGPDGDPAGARGRRLRREA
jgi:hypothetical protein